jgi:hypothetical protein
MPKSSMFVYKMVQLEKVKYWKFQEKKQSYKFLKVLPELIICILIVNSQVKNKQNKKKEI